MKAVCLTGNRPHKIPFAENSAEGDSLKARISDMVEQFAKDGYSRYITGMALGADIFFAECVSRLRDKYDITLEAAVPFTGQSKGFSLADRTRYDKILADADKVTVLSQNYTPQCYFVRNRYMVDNSDIVLAVDYGESGGTAGTVAYAVRQGKRVINLAK